MPGWNEEWRSALTVGGTSVLQTMTANPAQFLQQNFIARFSFIGLATSAKPIKSLPSQEFLPRKSSQLLQHIQIASTTALVFGEQKQTLQVHVIPSGIQDSDLVTNGQEVYSAAMLDQCVMHLLVRERGTARDFHMPIKMECNLKLLNCFVYGIFFLVFSGQHWLANWITKA